VPTILDAIAVFQKLAGVIRQTRDEAEDAKKPLEDVNREVEKITREWTDDDRKAETDKELAAREGAAPGKKPLGALGMTAQLAKQQEKLVTEVTRTYRDAAGTIKDSLEDTLLDMSKFSREMGDILQTLRETPFQMPTGTVSGEVLFRQMADAISRYERSVRDSSSRGIQSTQAAYEDLREVLELIARFNNGPTLGALSIDRILSELMSRRGRTSSRRRGTTASAPRGNTVANPFSSGKSTGRLP
jgi:predicted  nucleic acid-binding Zn-ribbon protein